MVEDAQLCGKKNPGNIWRAMLAIFALLDTGKLAKYICVRGKGVLDSRTGKALVLAFNSPSAPPIPTAGQERAQS